MPIITKERFEAAKTDRNELDQIVVYLRVELLRFISSNLKRKNPRIDVDDVLQETLVRSYALFERVEWRGERALFGWFCGIALHVVQESERRYLRINNQMPSDENGDESTPSRQLRRQERFERLEKSLKKLNPDESLVIKLIRIDGLPLKDVAGQLNRTEQGTYQLLWRSMKKLKAVFGDTVSLRLSDDRLAGTDDANDGK